MTRRKKGKIVPIREPNGRLSRADQDTAANAPPAVVRRLRDAALRGSMDGKTGKSGCPRAHIPLTKPKSKEGTMETIEVQNPLRIRVPDLVRKRGELQYHEPRIVVARALRNDPLGSMHARKQISDAQYRAGREWQAKQEAAGTPLKSSGDLQEPVDGSRKHRIGLTDRQRDAARQRAVWRDMLGGKNFALLEAVLIDKANLREAGELIFPDAQRKYVGWLFRHCLDQVAGSLGLTT